jgi:adenylate kinase
VVSASAQPRSLASAAPASDVLALATTADAQLVSAVLRVCRNLEQEDFGIVRADNGEVARRRDGDASWTRVEGAADGVGVPA